jgi:4-hydroxy-tetrahydrodipicolinate reductase
MIQTCLLGLGRTGAVVAEQLLIMPDFNLTAVFAKPGSPKSGHALSEYIKTNNALIVRSADSLTDFIKKDRPKVAIDFTSPEGSLKNIRILAEHGINVVVGTTGFNNMQVYELKNLVHKYRIGLVYAPNISLGINLLLTMVKTITRLIPHYDVEIIESHHRNKKDSPSGTALKIANEINNTKGGISGKYAFGRRGNQRGKGDRYSLRQGGWYCRHPPSPFRRGIR